MSLKTEKIHNIVLDNYKLILHAISNSMAQVYREGGFYTPGKKKIFLAPVTNEEECMEQVLAIANCYTSNEKGRVPFICDALHAFNNMIYGWYKQIDPIDWHTINCTKAARFCEIYNMEYMHVIDTLMKRVMRKTIEKIHEKEGAKWNEK